MLGERVKEGGGRAGRRAELEQGRAASERLEAVAILEAHYWRRTARPCLEGTQARRLVPPAGAGVAAAACAAPRLPSYPLLSPLLCCCTLHVPPPSALQSFTRQVLTTAAAPHSSSPSTASPRCVLHVALLCRSGQLRQQCAGGWRLLHLALALPLLGGRPPPPGLATAQPLDPSLQQQRHSHPEQDKRPTPATPINPHSI